MIIPLTESQFQRQVTDLAESYGWGWLHLERAQTPNGWRTVASGTLSAGFPDLLLVKGRRVLFVELKGQRGALSPSQSNLLNGPLKEAEHYVWRPDDWAQVMDVLHG